MDIKVHAEEIHQIYMQKFFSASVLHIGVKKQEEISFLWEKCYEEN